jgi:hypothetical protein
VNLNLTMRTVATAARFCEKPKIVLEKKKDKEVQELEGEKKERK